MEDSTEAQRVEAVSWCVYVDIECASLRCASLRCASLRFVCLFVCFCVCVFVFVCVCVYTSLNVCRTVGESITEGADCHSVFFLHVA